MPGLPLDSNGSLAAIDVEAQGPPELGKGAPMVSKTPNMDAVAARFQNPNANPGDGPTPGTPDGSNPLAALLQPQNPAGPKDPDELNLIEQIKQLNDRRQKLQQSLQTELEPDALKRYMPNGGKVKPSDLLADALFNTAQLNLRNPTYGSLKGHDYTPIQQQRMDQAIKLHQSAIQNITQQETITRDEANTALNQLNQKRLETQHQDTINLQKDQYQLAVQKQMDLVKQNAEKNRISDVLAKSRVGLMSAQQAKAEIETVIKSTYHGNKPDFMADWVREHRDDPDYVDQYISLRKKLEPTKSPTGTTVFVPNQQGGYNVMRVDQGSQIPAGARTIASISTDSTFPATTRTMISNAPAVLNLADRMDDLLDKNERALGPLASRWNEFTTGKVGIPGEDYAKLRTVSALLQTKLMQMHVGSRGSTEIMKHFKEIIDNSVQSPENLRAALAEIRLYAQQVAQETPPNAPTSISSPIAPPPPPKPTTPEPGKLHNGKRVAKVEIVP